MHKSKLNRLHPEILPLLITDYIQRDVELLTYKNFAQNHLPIEKTLLIFYCKFLNILIILPSLEFIYLYLCELSTTAWPLPYRVRLFFLYVIVYFHLIVHFFCLLCFTDRNFQRTVEMRGRIGGMDLWFYGGNNADFGVVVLVFFRSFFRSLHLVLWQV